MSPSPVLPKNVAPLHHWRASPWRWKLRLSTALGHRRLTKGLSVGLILTVAVFIALQAASTNEAVAVIFGCGLILMLVYMSYDLLIDPQPLTSMDTNDIVGWLEQNPAWEDRVAAWLSHGPLDQRHYASLHRAAVVNSLARRRDEALSLRADIDARLRGWANGRLGAQAERLRLNRVIPSSVGPLSGSGRTAKTPKINGSPAATSAVEEKADEASAATPSFRL